MPHDLFISYAHQGDNTSREAVAALVARLHAELEADFRRRFNRDLEIFFDREDIRDFDHWQVRCHRALRDSRFFITCLSRTYLRSDACRWEWEEWCRHELEHGLVGQGAASLWFVKLEDLDTLEDAALLRRWQGELLQRFHIQCHEWRHDDHGNFLDAAARSELQQLTEHVAQRLRLLTLDRVRRGNLPWPNTNFVGREPELASLRVALLDAPERSRAGIHGVGGMGKTALAQTFGYKEADAFPGGCWVLRCEGRDRLLTVLRTLVSDLEIELTDEEKLEDTKAMWRVFDVLRARGPALFVLDNVDHPALLAQEQMKLLADQPWARVLYTTRLAPDDFTKAGAVIRPLDLDRLPENQAVDLIRRYQPVQAFASGEHEAAAREIVYELSGLTLAVETAAVYLGQCDPRTTEPQYAVDVRNYLTKLREDLNAGGSEGVMSQLREVTATLRPTLARLDAPARTVLQIASMLAPDGVALPWLRAIAGQSHPELAADAATGKSDPWTQLIRSLIGMRLFQPTAEPRVVTTHRFLQRVLASELPDEEQHVEGRLEEHIHKCNEVLARTHQWDDARWELDPLAALGMLWADADTYRAAWLCENTAGHLFKIANWSKAERLLERALEILERSLDADHPEVHHCRHNLAQLFALTNRIAEAEPLMRSALTVYEREYSPDHPRVRLCLTHLAQLLIFTHRITDAEQLLRRVLEIQERNPNVDEFGDSGLSAALNNLAHLFMATNRMGEAEPLLRRSLSISEPILGADHPQIATRLNNLGTVLQQVNRPSEAEPLMRRAVANFEQSYGTHHPTVAALLSNLAQLLVATNRISEAESLARRVTSIFEQSFGMDNFQTGQAINNLAQLLVTAGRPAEAEPLFQNALVILEKSLGPQHPLVATILSNLGRMLIPTNRRNEAENLLRRALAINEKTLSPNHPDLALVLNNLALTLEAKGQLIEAVTLIARSYTILRKLSVENGRKNPNTALVFKNFLRIWSMLAFGLAVPIIVIAIIGGLILWVFL